MPTVIRGSFFFLKLICFYSSLHENSALEKEKNTRKFSKLTFSVNLSQNSKRYDTNKKKINLILKKGGDNAEIGGVTC